MVKNHDFQALLQKKFINVSKLQGTLWFHLDGLTLQVETPFGLQDPQDEGRALHSIGNYLSINSVYHSRRLEFSSAPLQPHTEHTSSSEANSCSASQYVLSFFV